MIFDNVKMPYIAVTGFTTRKQVEKAKLCVQSVSNRRLKVGATMNYEPFYEPEADERCVQLRFDGLRELFVPDVEVFNVLQWTDNAPLSYASVKALVKACENCGPGLSGVQLDMVWPNYEMVMEIKNRLPDLLIILQVNTVAMQDLRAWRYGLEYKLSSYVGRVDYVLFDYEIGGNVALCAQEMFSFIAAARRFFPESAIAFKGGFGPKTLYPLFSVLEKFPNISWEAESCLYKNRSDADLLDIKVAYEYLRKSSHIAAVYNK